MNLLITSGLPFLDRVIEHFMPIRCSTLRSNQESVRLFTVGVSCKFWSQVFDSSDIAKTKDGVKKRERRRVAMRMGVKTSLPEGGDARGTTAFVQLAFLS